MIKTNPWKQFFSTTAFLIKSFIFSFLISIIGAQLRDSMLLSSNERKITSNINVIFYETFTAFLILRAVSVPAHTGCLLVNICNICVYLLEMEEYCEWKNIVKNDLHVSNYDIRRDIINVNGEVLRVLWYTNYFIECKFTGSDVRDSNYSSMKK